MEDKRHNSDLDHLIKSSIEITDVPSAQLNNRLKKDIYRREALLKQQIPIRSISLWYVPMLLNLFTFLLLGALSRLMISNPYLSTLAALLCGYIAIAGVIITVVGVKRTNLKENITIHIEKRGALA